MINFVKVLDSANFLDLESRINCKIIFLVKPYDNHVERDRTHIILFILCHTITCLMSHYDFYKIGFGLRAKRDRSAVAQISSLKEETG